MEVSNKEYDTNETQFRFTCKNSQLRNKEF